MLNKKKHPLICLTNNIMQQNSKFSAKMIARSYEEFGDAWADAFEMQLMSIAETEHALSQAIRGYSAFALKSMRMQAAFERTRKYPEKSYSKAQEDVYLNNEIMTNEYLPGLLLSHFLWPHHYRQLQFFEHLFVSQIKQSQTKSFIEIGVGTGIYSSLLLQKCPAITGLGIDISPAAQNFVEKRIHTLKLKERYQIILKNLLTDDIQIQTDCLLCVEVLEHLEDPTQFLAKLRSCLRPGGKAFITAALNAAHEDHIYLYRSPDEVRAHLIETGFVIEQVFSALAYPPSSPEISVPEVAAFIVS